MSDSANRSVSRSVSRSQPGVVKTFLSNRLALVGLILIALFASMVLAHPLLMNTLWADSVTIYNPVTGYDAPIIDMTVVEVVEDPTSEVSLIDARLAGNWDASVGDVVDIRVQPAPPSADHWLGTDPFGRDVFSMLLNGAWPTFVVGLSAALVSALIGTLMATASAVFRGGVDRILSRFSDVLLLLPAPLAMVILGGGLFSDFLSPIVFGTIYGVIAGASTVAIVLRSHALSTVERPFVDAARVSGARGWYLGRRHLMPHLVPLAAVSMVTAVVGAVVAHGFASWLAFSDEMTNWGAMMFIAIGFADLQGVVAWNVLISGAAAISLFCAAFYLVSLGLKDVAYRGAEASRRKQGWATRSSRSETLV